MNRILSGAIAISMGLSATAALAQESVADKYNTYIGLGGGVNVIPDNDARVTSTAVTPNGPVTSTTTGDAEFENGWAGLGSIGVYLDNAWRVELETSYRENDLDGFAGGAASGDVNGWAIMFNALKDIPNSSAVTPYIGAGIGVARREFSLDGVGDDTDTGLAYQGIAGASVDVGERTQLFADYRFFATHDLEYGDPAIGAAVEDWDDHNHTIMIGLRVAFNPKAAPMPEGPAAPESFVIYFDVDSSKITPEAAATLDQVAASAKAGNVIRLDLEGHTSTTATADYNMGLSERRVNATRDALAARGVNLDAMNTAFFGESALAVPTADNVEEPLNRRATIVFGN